MNVSENTLSSWSNPPGKTEQEKCARAEAAVRKAIKADNALGNLNISVFAQGSYRAHTNVRQNSDVDICIRHNDVFFPDYPPGATDATFGNVEGGLSFPEFKDMVGRALVNSFGASGVTRGNKSFDVHENTYRIDADVVPTFEHRRYSVLPDGSYDYLSGVAFLPDSGMKIINWPQQTYDNGVSRNLSTGKRYKRIIRVMKRLRDKMRDERIAIATSTPSFLIECLVWNADVAAFNQHTYTDMLRYVIADTWQNTRSDDTCGEWGEVNGLKYLFGNHQPWKRQEVNSFLQAAWDYIGYQ